MSISQVIQTDTKGFDHLISNNESVDFDEEFIIVDFWKSLCILFIDRYIGFEKLKNSPDKTAILAVFGFGMRNTDQTVQVKKKHDNRLN